MVKYMITISVCMIVKNEELVLERALNSIKDIADEIIIVDTGSLDDTKRIAAKYTDKIFDFKWCNDFSQARNYSFSKATKDYCMWLDADDILLENDKLELLKLKETLPLDTSIVMMKYNTDFDNKGDLTTTYYRERLLKRTEEFQWEGFIHEIIYPRGNVIYSEIAITHQKNRRSDPYRNLRIFKIKEQDGIAFSPREMFYYARELYYHQYYNEAIAKFKYFLNSKKGWREDNISACQFLGNCYYKKGDMYQAITWLLKSLCYDVPRAEISCNLGKYFYELRCYEQAIFWYAVALSCRRNDESGAFVSPDCYNYIPYTHLCLCYDTLKDYKTANFYNDLAGKCKPNDAVYLNNKRYLHRILSKK